MSIDAEDVAEILDVPRYAALVRALEAVRVAAQGIHIKADRDGKPVIIGMLPLSEALAACDKIRSGT